MTTYHAAPEPVLELVQKVQREHHKHLDGWKLEVVFRDVAARTKGKTVLGKARTVTGLNSYLAREAGDTFFVLELADDAWEALANAQREALVDHELCHFQVKTTEDGDEVPYLAPHDLEEFNDVVLRRGLWKPDLQAFAEAAQLPLFGKGTTVTIERNGDPNGKPDKDLQAMGSRSKKAAPEVPA
jgi:hypothetical protein